MECAVIQIVLTDIDCRPVAAKWVFVLLQTGVFLGCSGYALPPKERCKQTINLVPGDEFIAADSEDGEVKRTACHAPLQKCGTAMDSYVLDGNP